MLYKCIYLLGFFYFSIVSVVIDGETYHVFGINWSEGKMEWYIDDQIVRSVDYSDDPAAKAALDRPQYIQLNFATGGNCKRYG